MRKYLIGVLLIFFLCIPVHAMNFTAPEVPQDGERFMPENEESFLEGVWYIFKSAIGDLQPEITSAAGVCLSVIGISVVISVVFHFSDQAEKVTRLVCTVALGTLLLNQTDSMIKNGIDVIQIITEYGKLLLSVLTAVLAAQGGTTSSVALYTATSLFGSILSTVITKLIVPMLYIFICLSLICNAIEGNTLDGLRKFIKWLMTWSLKTVLYCFTGYMSITGVITGTADASALKVARMTISSTIPVVGGILSDTSEAVLVGAGVMKNAAGIYGLMAILAIWIGPFLKTGVQYLLLKMTASVCAIFDSKVSSSVLEDFVVAMGFVLAMTGTVCILHLISTVCFMKGVA